MPSGPPQVVQDDRGLRQGAGQRRHLFNLRMVLPGIEGEAQRAQLRHALAEGRLAVESRRRVGVAVAHVGAVVPAAGVADAAKAAVAGRDVRLEHRAARAPSVMST